MEYKLIIFDLDGTLSPMDKPVLFNDAKAWIDANPKQAWCIASNQGGVGLRYWMERDGFGEPNKYPTAEQFERRLDSLFGDQHPMVLRCYRYQSKKSGQWCPVPPGCDDKEEWYQGNRKPAAGMLTEAMSILPTEATETLMVGDSPEDQQAAIAAGCKFQWAWEFFGRPEPKTTADN